MGENDEIVVNGQEAEDDGKRGEHDSELDAKCMVKAEIDALFNDLKAQADKTIKDLDKTRNGEQYQDSIDSLNLFVDLLRNGPHMEVARKNKWLGNPEKRAEYLKRSNVGQTEFDRHNLVRIYDLGTKTAELTGAISKFVNFFNGEVLQSIFKASSFYKNMKDLYKPDDFAEIDRMLLEFSALVNRYNTGSIYSQLGISKSSSFTDDYDQVRMHLEKDIMKSSHISKYLVNTRMVDCYQANMFHYYDRVTFQFDAIAQKADTIKSAINQIDEITGSLCKYEKMDVFPASIYFDGIRQVGGTIRTALSTALSIIDQFRNNSSEAPFAILHYSNTVKDIAGNYLSVKLDDPLQNGTLYAAILSALPRKCDQLCREVAEGAPSVM